MMGACGDAAALEIGSGSRPGIVTSRGAEGVPSRVTGAVPSRVTGGDVTPRAAGADSCGGDTRDCDSSGAATLRSAGGGSCVGFWFGS
jgi:hypothetical protein